MKLILKNTNISCCISALDFYMRLFLGQYDEIDFILRMYRIYDDEFAEYEFARKHLYTAMRNIVFHEESIAEWDLNGSLGIWSEHTDLRAKNAYDIQQVIRYHDSWCRIPEGGIGRNFDKPLFGGDLNPIFCKCEMQGDNEVMELELEKQHIEIMILAAEVYKCLFSFRIRKMMEYCTSDSRVLDIAKILEKLYNTSDVSENEINYNNLNSIYKLIRCMKNVQKQY